MRIAPARVAALAYADLLERARRPAFLVLLGVGLWAAWVFTPPNHSAYATFRMADARGLYGSAWIGATVAMLTAVFFSLAGFYVVKNAIAGDRKSRVGEVLATSTTSNVEYMLGKWLSNTSLLGAFTLVMMVGAALMQPARGEDPAFEPWALAAPFLWVTLPAMAVTSALAVLFEAIPGLRGGPGNVAYFFVWSFALLAPGTPFAQEAALWDPLGTRMLVTEMLRAGRDAIPAFRDHPGSFSIGLNFRQGGWHLETFAWEGVRWTPALVVPRLAWFAGAGVVAAIAALPFDRFSGETRSLRRGPKAAPAPPRPDAATAIASLDPTALPAGIAWGALAPVARGFSAVTLALAELRLLTRRTSRWWWLTWAALQIPAVVAPSDIASRFAAMGWIWPVFRWSELGARDRVNGTAALLDSSPHPIGRQLPAAWAAGACLALLAGAGFGMRSLLSGNPAAVAGWLAGAAFVPALALALGTLSRGRKTFEILFVVLWYVGPLNGVPFADFSGATGGSAAPGFALAALAALGIAAWTRRARMGFA